MVWEGESLFESVEKIFGLEQKNLLAESYSSIVERQNYAEFHFLEASSIFNNFFENKPTSKDSFDLIFKTNSADTEEFEVVKLKTRANIVAFLQSIHSVSDILSHVIFYSLGLNLKPEKTLSIDRLYIIELIRFLKKDMRYPVLIKLLEELTNHEDYKYLNSIVNHSKHRSVIEPYFNANFKKPDGEHHEIKFKKFNFKSVTYNQKVAFDYMKSEYNRQGELVISIGNEVNRIVSEIF